MSVQKPENVATEAAAEPEEKFDPLTLTLENTLVVEDMEDVEDWEEEAKTAFMTSIKKEVGVEKMDAVSHTIICRPVSSDVRALIEEAQDRPLAANAMEIEINLQFKNIRDATNVYQTMATKSFANIVQKSLTSGTGAFPSALVSTIPGSFSDPAPLEPRKRPIVQPDPAFEPQRTPSNTSLKPIMTETIKRKLPFSKREDELDKKKIQELADAEKEEAQKLNSVDDANDNTTDPDPAETPGLPAPVDPFLTSAPHPTNTNIDVPTTSGINVFFNSKHSNPLPEPIIPSPRMDTSFLNTKGLPLPSLTNLPASGIDSKNLVLLRVRA